MPSTFLRRLSSTASEQFREAMSRVASQSMILTAGAKPGHSPLHGMTLSSVSSLAVSPSQLLLFNLHLPSYTSQALQENGGLLALHVMPPTAKAAALGRRFAAGIKRDPTHFDSPGDDGESFHEMTTPFKGLDGEYTMHNAAGGVQIPILRELEVTFVCEKHTLLKVENHEIWVVKVHEILHPNKAASEYSGGLLYFQRGFHKIGDFVAE